MHRLNLPQLLILAFLPVQAGCVALNIPSQRFHDPSDRGGLLGHWNGVGQPGHSAHEEHLLSADEITVHAEFHAPADPHCLDGGPLIEDPLDPYGDNHRKKPPEIPWPRFHPVPTRPVFGSTLP